MHDHTHDHVITADFPSWIPDNDLEEPPIPVTIISGFLGSGKTTLLKHLLQSKPGGDYGLIINDVGEVNIDAHEVESRFPSGGETVQRLSKLTKGCICCSLQPDLANALVYFWEESKPAHILIESSGAANPRNILQTFYNKNYTGHTLTEVFSLSNLITVVDMPHFLSEWDKATGDTKTRRQIFLNDPRTPYLELIMEQIETCDVLVLNKMDLLSEEEQTRPDLILEDLNPRALRTMVTEGKVEAETLLDIPRFDLNKTQKGSRIFQHLEQPKPKVPGLFESKLSVSSGGLLQNLTAPKRTNHGYGLETLIFTSRQPADQAKLFRVLRSKIPGVVRAKGFYWTTERLDQCGVLSLAGNILRADYAGPWYIDLYLQGRAQLDHMPETIEIAWQDPPIGDRRQEIVFIGVNLDKELLSTELNNCLTTYTFNE